MDSSSLLDLSEETICLDNSKRKTRKKPRLHKAKRVMINVGDTSDRSYLTQSRLIATGYKRKIKDLLLNNKYLAKGLEEAQLHLTEQGRMLAEKDRELDKQMIVKTKLNEMFTYFTKSFSLLTEALTYSGVATAQDQTSNLQTDMDFAIEPEHQVLAAVFIPRDSSRPLYIPQKISKPTDMSLIAEVSAIDDSKLPPILFEDEDEDTVTVRRTTSRSRRNADSQSSTSSMESRVTTRELRYSTKKKSSDFNSKKMTPKGSSSPPRLSDTPKTPSFLSTNLRPCSAQKSHIPEFIKPKKAQVASLVNEADEGKSSEIANIAANSFEDFVLPSAPLVNNSNLPSAKPTKVMDAKSRIAPVRRDIKASAVAGKSTQSDGVKQLGKAKLTGSKPKCNAKSLEVKGKSDKITSQEKITTLNLRRETFSVAECLNSLEGTASDQCLAGDGKEVSDVDQSCRRQTYFVSSNDDQPMLKRMSYLIDPKLLESDLMPSDQGKDKLDEEEKLPAKDSSSDLNKDEVSPLVIDELVEKVVSPNSRHSNEATTQVVSDPPLQKELIFNITNYQCQDMSLTELLPPPEAIAAAPVPDLALGHLMEINTLESENNNEKEDQPPAEPNAVSNPDAKKSPAVGINEGKTGSHPIRTSRRKSVKNYAESDSDDSYHIVPRAKHSARSRKPSLLTNNKECDAKSLQSDNLFDFSKKQTFLTLGSAKKPVLSSKNVTDRVQNVYDFDGDNTDDSFEFDGGCLGKNLKIKPGEINFKRPFIRQNLKYPAKTLLSKDMQLPNNLDPKETRNEQVAVVDCVLEKVPDARDQKQSKDNGPVISKGKNSVVQKENDPTHNSDFRETNLLTLKSPTKAVRGRSRSSKPNRNTKGTVEIASGVEGTTHKKSVDDFNAKTCTESLGNQVQNDAGGLTSKGTNLTDKSPPKPVRGRSRSSKPNRNAKQTEDIASGVEKRIHKMSVDDLNVKTSGEPLGDKMQMNTGDIVRGCSHSSKPNKNAKVTEEIESGVEGRTRKRSVDDFNIRTGTESLADQVQTNGGGIGTSKDTNFTDKSLPKPIRGRSRSSRPNGNAKGAAVVTLTGKDVEDLKMAEDFDKVGQSYEIRDVNDRPNSNDQILVTSEKTSVMQNKNSSFSKDDSAQNPAYQEANLLSNESPTKPARGRSCSSKPNRKDKRVSDLSSVNKRKRKNSANDDVISQANKMCKNSEIINDMPLADDQIQGSVASNKNNSVMQKENSIPSKEDDAAQNPNSHEANLLKNKSPSKSTRGRGRSTKPNRNANGVSSSLGGKRKNPVSNLDDKDCVDSPSGKIYKDVISNRLVAEDEKIKISKDCASSQASNVCEDFEMREIIDNAPTTVDVTSKAISRNTVGEHEKISHDLATRANPEVQLSDGHAAVPEKKVANPSEIVGINLAKTQKPGRKPKMLKSSQGIEQAKSCTDAKGEMKGKAALGVPANVLRSLDADNNRSKAVLPKSNKEQLSKGFKGQIKADVPSDIVCEGKRRVRPPTYKEPSLGKKLRRP